MPSRRVTAALAAVAVLAGLGVAYLGYRNLGDPPISGSVLGFEVVSPGRVTVRFAVQRDHPERAADCVLRARARDGTEVGRLDVAVPPGPADVARSVELHTSGPIMIAEVLSCRYRP